MNNKTKTIFFSGLVTFAMAFSLFAFLGLKKTETLYSGASNEKSVTDVTSTSITLSNNYSLSAKSEGLTDGSLFSLSENGYIRNTEPIRGITSITVTYSSSSKAKIVPCYYDYESDAVVPTTEDWPEASTTANFASSPIDYFELYNANNDAITITSIVIGYSCSTSLYTFNASFIPDWNGHEALEHADIYIAGTPELISDGTSGGGWNYKKMTYNAGTYSYTAPNYLPTGIYQYSFYAIKNGNAFSWSNQTTDGSVTIELDSNISDTHSYEWEREPGSAVTYTLNIEFYETDSGAWATWRGFNYSTSNSGISSGNWGADLTWVSKTDGVNKYTVSGFEVESASSTIYVAIKCGVTNDSNTQDPTYIGLSTTNAFAISYAGGATTATLTVNMTLSTVSTAYAATSYNIETSGGVVVSGMSHDNVSMDIYDLDESNKTITNGRKLISPTFESGTDTFTASFSGNNIRIDTIDGNQYITALKAGTATTVTLTADSDPTVNCQFTVTVPSSSYTATSTRDSKWAADEGWFTAPSVSQINNMDEDFYNGVDISSCKALYQNGTNFYNASGVEESLFYILKNAGINWVRLKLWVDPYTNSGTSYGGGESDLNNTLWMAYEAKAAGLKLLLDFHYSDYWTHPGQQIIPKAWASANSASALATYIKSYTKNTLNTFYSNGCLPDMVQLGNEISSGNFLKLPGADSETFTYYKPSYLTKASNFSYKGDAGSNNMKTYLTAGVEAVNEINTSLGKDIKTVIHWAKGSTISADVINNFFNSISSVNYDYAGISFYPYYCFDSLSGAQTILNGLNIGKPWFIAEISYPFSNGSWVYEEVQGAPTYNVTDGLIGTGSSDITNIFNVYSPNPTGQANLIHDITAATINAGGLGIFYWEPAWVPNAWVGWAASGSSCSWSNQGFFSYDGKAIGNLQVFAQMSPHI